MTTTQAQPRGGVLDQVQLHHVTDLDTLDAFRRWAGERRDVLCADTESAVLAWWAENAITSFNCRHGRCDHVVT
jgi:hypothetical protein